jgi:hypothetical protein
MILANVVITMYTFCTFSIVLDEVWNIQHPRPNPKKHYYALEWEREDFYPKKINGEWVLKKYRKTDNENKRYIRNKYWEKK